MSGKRRFERRASDVSLDSLQVITTDFRNQVEKLRTKVETEKKQAKHVNWQRVLDVKAIKEQEQQKHQASILELKAKLQNEKARELDQLRESLLQKHSTEIQKLKRQKNVEILKLTQQVDSKESLLQKTISEIQKSKNKCLFDSTKEKWLKEMDALKEDKRKLEESLETASKVERSHYKHLRRASDTHELELSMFRRNTQLEISQLIEQLKNKDKIISHLEKELGQQSGYAVKLQLQKDSIQEQLSMAKVSRPTGSSVSHNQETNGTNSSSNIPDILGEEKVMINMAELEFQVSKLETENASLSQDNIQLLKKVKDLEGKLKPVQEKNKKFLEKNMELTSANRTYKDKIQIVSDEIKKVKDQNEQVKRKVSNLSQQLCNEKHEKQELECKLEEKNKLERQIKAQNELVSALRQTCAEKDRRIELIQHRKKRRRLFKSQEKAKGSPCLKETYFGYDEDNTSDISETSQSSISHGTISDEEIMEEITKDEVEKNYKKLMKEHMELQRVYSLLQTQTGNQVDPERLQKIKSQLEADLIAAQFKVEKLTHELNEKGCHGCKDMANLLSKNRDLGETLEKYKVNNVVLHQDLSETSENLEIMEFRVLEMEEIHNKQNEDLQGEIAELEKQKLVLKSMMSITEKVVSRYSNEVEDLRKQLRNVLDGRGKEGEILKDKLEELEQSERRVEELEKTAQELQEKVIILQKEKSSLQDRLSRNVKGQPEEVVRWNEEQLSELKGKLQDSERSEFETIEKNMHLNETLESYQVQNNHMKSRILELETKLEVLKGQKAADEVIPIQRHQSCINKTVQCSSVEKLSKSSQTDLPQSSDDDGSLVTVSSNQKSCHESEEESFNTATQSELVTSSVDVTSHSFDDFDDYTDDVKIQLLTQQIQEYDQENRFLMEKIERLQTGECQKSEHFTLEMQVEELEENVTKFEERCGDYQMNERQLKDKLKLAEHTINDLESIENATREKYEMVQKRENEAKRQILDLHRTVQELKDIILDKDVIESSLKEKEMGDSLESDDSLLVQCLEETNKLSANTITELEANKKALEQQLKQLREDFAKSNDKEQVVTLHQQVNCLEKANKALSDRILELEDNEQVMRRNWMQAADEDANRIERLNEKIKHLQSSNSDLKVKLVEVQEDILINGNGVSMSLASELSAIHSNAEYPFHERDERTGSDSKEQTQADILRCKIIELENKLEEKTSTIENLYEKVADMKDNEIKLSEALTESEQSEHQFKQKLALYENKEVTVERLLTYEDKLKEFASSQENLLDRIDSLEDHETDMQETITNKEKFYEGKISSLESEITDGRKEVVELSDKIKDYQNKNDELDNQISSLEKEKNEYSDKICNLESKIDLLQKQETELTEKITYLENHVIKSLEHETDAALQSLEEESLVSTELREKCDELEENIFSLSNENEGLKEEKNVLNKIIADLKSTKEKQAMMSSERESLKNENKDLKNQLEDFQEIIYSLTNEKTELLDKLEVTEKRIQDLLSKLDLQGNERNKIEILKEKVEVLTDGEEKLMERVNELEEIEESLREKLEKLNSPSIKESSSSCLHLISVPPKEGTGSECKHPVAVTRPLLCDKSTATDKNAAENGEGSSKVGGLFQRLQDLEKHNQELNMKLNEITATDKQVKELKEKVRLLEQSEDKLMERVMEHEEVEEDLKKEISKLKGHTEISDSSDIEEENFRLQQSEYKLSEKVMLLEKDVESSKVRCIDLENNIRKYEELVRSMEDSEKSLQDQTYAQKTLQEDLHKAENRLEEVQADYETKVGALDLDMKMLKEEKNCVIKEKEQLINEKNELQLKLENLEKNLHSLEEEKSHLLQEIKVLSIDKDNLEDKISRVGLANDESDFVQKPCSHPENHLAFSSEHVSAFSTSIDSGIQEHNGHVDDPTTEKMQDVKDREYFYEMKIHDLEDQVKKLTHYAQSNSFDTPTNKYDHGDNLIKPSVDLVETLEAENLALKTHLSELEKQNHILTNQISALKQDLEDASSKYGETCRLESNGLTKTEIHMKVTDDRKTEVDKLLSTISNLQMTNNELTQTIQGLEKKFPEKIDSAIQTSETKSFILTERCESSPECSLTEMPGKKPLCDLNDSTEIERVIRPIQEVLNNILDGENTPTIHQIEKALQQKTKTTSSQNPVVSAFQTSFKRLVRLFLELKKKQESQKKLFRSEICLTKPKSLTPEKSSSNISKDSETSQEMLESPEDILNKRIQELEKLEKYLKQQVNDLENDRDELHTIARKDKNIIHDQNVKIRELQLSEKTLKVQVSQLETSECQLFSEVEDLKNKLSRFEDRIRELEVIEGRLKDLVHKYKLDEELLIVRSENMQSTVQEISEAKTNLKHQLIELEGEHTGLTQKSDNLESRVKELEVQQSELTSQLKKYKEIESSFQNRIKQLESSEAGAVQKASGLETAHANLMTDLHRKIEENTAMSYHMSQQQGQIQNLERELRMLKDAEFKAKQEVSDSQKNETSLHSKVKEYQLKEIELQGQVRRQEQEEIILKDKVSSLQRSENKLKYRIQELESSGSQGSEDVSSSEIAKLPRNLEDCQKKLIVLQQNNKQLQMKLSANDKNKVSGDDMITVPSEEFIALTAKVAEAEQIELQLNEVKKLNGNLQESLGVNCHTRKDTCDKGEVDVLQKQLRRSNEAVQMLVRHLSGSETVYSGQLKGLFKEVNNKILTSRAVPNDVQVTQSEEKFDTLEKECVKTHYKIPEECVDKLIESLEKEKLRSQTVGQEITEEKIIQKSIGGVYSSAPPRGENIHSDSNATMATELSMKRSEWPQVAGAKTMNGGIIKRSDKLQEEEMVVGIMLQSETESTRSQNDTDSVNSSPLFARRQGLKLQAQRGDSLDDYPAPPLPNTLPPPLPSKGGFEENVQILPSPLKDSSDGDITFSGRKSVRKPFQGSLSQEAIESTVRPVNSTSSLPNRGRGTTSAPSTRHMMSLKERIGQIENQLKTKDMNENRKGDDDNMFAWMSQVTEKNRLLDISVVENKQLKDEVNRLEKEIEKKNTYIKHLEDFIDGLEKLLQGKFQKNTTDKELIDDIKNHLGRSQVDIKDAMYKAGTLNDAASLKSALDRKDRELTTKKNEVDALKKELQQWQDECKQIDDMRSNAVDSLRTLQYEVLEYQDMEKQTKGMKLDYTSMKEKFAEAQKTIESLQAADRQREELECQVKDLMSKVKEYGRIDTENSSLQGKLNGMTILLKDRMEKVQQLSEEVVELRDTKSYLEQKSSSLEKSNINLENISVRYDEMENQKNKALTSVAPYRAKVTRLLQKCNEKDVVIRRLINELRQGTKRGHTTRLLEELKKIEGALAKEDYYMSDASSVDMFQDDLEAFTDFKPIHRKKQDLDLSFNSDTSSVGDPRELMSDSEVHVSTKTVELQRPRSAELRRNHNHSHSRHHNSHHRKNLHESSDGEETLTNRFEAPAPGSMPDSPFFVAIASYNPDIYSKSGRPRLEIPLKEGDKVKVTGPADGHGFYEAEVNGRIGLVPSNYLQPLPQSSLNGMHSKLHERRIKQLKNAPSYLDSTPEEVLLMHNQLQQVSNPGAMRLPTINGHATNGGSTSPRHHSNSQQISRQKSSPRHHQPTSPRHHPTSSRHYSSRNTKTQASIPPPSNLQVEKIVGDNGIMLSWQLPYLDDHSKNNGVHITGYQIHVDGRLGQQVNNPKVSKSVISNIDITCPHQFSIQSVALNDLVSKPVHLEYEGFEDTSNESFSDADSDISLSSIHYKEGPQRLFVGVYDYIPSIHSPRDHPGSELSFRAGDVIVVFGKLRKDGFYFGEIDGKRGLVPASFTEEIPANKQASPQGNIVSHNPTSQSSQFTTDRKIQRKL